MNLDFLRNLRLQSLFGNMGKPPIQDPGMTFPNPGVNSMPPQPPESGVFDIGQRMKELYTPDTTSTDRFNTMVDQYPQMPTPSFGRRLGAATLAGLADVAGQGGGKNIWDTMTGKTDFNEKVTNWKNQIGPLEQSANIERQTNSNERTMAHQQIADELRQQAQDAKNKNDEIKSRIAQQRADAYEFKARNLNMKIIVPKGGNIQAIDPRTGVAHDTGIPTGSLTDADRISLEQENKIEQIHTQADETRKTEDVKNTNVLGQIGARAEESRKTKVVPSGNSTANKPPTEASIRTGRVNKANELRNTRPELSKWIVINGNDVKITPVATGMFGRGPTKEQFDEINNFIYGSKSPETGGRGAGPGIPPPTQPQVLSKQVRNKTTGEVMTVYSHDGGKTWGSK